MTLTEAISTVRQLSPEDRDKLIRERFAERSVDPAELQWRAILVTRLREEKLWP